MELGKIDEAKSALESCIENNESKTVEREENFVIAWTILMAYYGQVKDAHKFLKFSTKNFIGFTVPTQLLKAKLE